jgi:hypothetical protein
VAQDTSASGCAVAEVGCKAHRLIYMPWQVFQKVDSESPNLSVGLLVVMLNGALSSGGNALINYLSLLCNCI